MSLYSAFFVRSLHGVVDSFREAEAFVFHTRLAHVSPSLRDRDVTRAVDKLALMAQGIGGGTRIGERKEAAMIYAQGMGMPVAVGTPADIADQMVCAYSEHARAEIQPLGDIVVLLGDRIGVVDAERAERRIPDQAGADRRADRARIGDLL
jgi:VWA domain containing CoxE-like protein